MNRHIAEKLQRKAIRILRGDISYPEWNQKNRVSEEEQQRQREESSVLSGPLFSVVVPLYRTPEVYLDEMIESVRKQTYPFFELCLADGSPEGEDCRNAVGKYLQDSRVIYQRLSGNQGISGNTNEAIRMAKGDFVVLCDHDDRMTEDALYCLAKKILQEPECDCLYSDEDKLDDSNGSLYMPHFKPDYDPDLLTSVNYICHLFAFRRELTEKYGMFNPAYDGAQDHDFILRMCEKSRKVCHVNRVLYHWRCHPESTAANPESKRYAFEAGKNAVLACYQRVCPDLPVQEIRDGANAGLYRTVYDSRKVPSVSVICTGGKNTARMLQSLFTGEYSCISEIIVPEGENLPSMKGKLVQAACPSSLSEPERRNLLAAKAGGDLLLFLDDDVWMKDAGSAEEMAGVLMRPAAGICGCRILDRKDRIVHAGEIIRNGKMYSLFCGQHTELTWFNRALTLAEYSAVSGKVIMIRRTVFESLKGFRPEMENAAAEDLCLRAGELGIRTIYTPYACFTAEHSEQKHPLIPVPACFTEAWENSRSGQDPHYNSQLSAENAEFTL